ncbi:MAG: hypothetical protein GF331_09435 [Chitinivibrionales bacterium]|nr:hypothetical protein [Chitinivibrionales bacterium]
MAAAHYRRILSELGNRGVRFVVCGGVAAVLHGVERLTLDIDIALDFEPRNVEVFVDVMTGMGMKPRVPVDPMQLCNAEFVKMIVEEKNAIVFTFIDPDKAVKQVDVFLTDELAYAKLLPDTEELTLGDTSVRLLTKRKLLALKEAIDPPRDKDVLDLRELRRLVAQEQEEHDRG